MSIKKRFMSVVVAFVMAMCFSLTCSASVFAVTPDEAEDSEVTVMEAVQEALPAGEEVVTIATASGGISPCANAGPIAQTPSTMIICDDSKTVQGKEVLFFLKVPSGETVNAIYLIGKNTSGYSTTVAVLGLGTTSYRADLDGIWYRVSNNNLGIKGETTIVIDLAISDSYHPYNVIIAGCK